MIAMAGAARADAPQPSVVRPEIAQGDASSSTPGECELISVRAASDDGLFGSAGVDGIH